MESLPKPSFCDSVKSKQIFSVTSTCYGDIFLRTEKIHIKELNRIFFLLTKEVSKIKINPGEIKRIVKAKQPI